MKNSQIYMSMNKPKFEKGFAQTVVLERTVVYIHFHPVDFEDE